MDGQVLIFPQGNDIVVTARFPGISDGTGAQSEFSDPTTMVYTSAIIDDPDNPGQTMSTFEIPREDVAVTGAFWWRVDCIDTLSSRRTASCGTLLVEAVLCSGGLAVGSCISSTWEVSPGISVIDPGFTGESTGDQKLIKDRRAMRRRCNGSGTRGYAAGQGKY
jgi:hypothetical protein